MKKLSSKFKNIVTLSLLVLCTFALAIAGVFGATKQSEMKTDGIQARAEMASYDKIGKIDFLLKKMRVQKLSANSTKNFHEIIKKLIHTQVVILVVMKILV